MKKILILLVVFTVSLSCNEEPKNKNLEKLNERKTALAKSIDSLNSKLKLIDEEISKLDTLKKLQTVTTIVAKKELFSHYFEIQGIVKSDKNIGINPEMGGAVKSIYVKEGQNVKAGQVLVQLDDSEIINGIDELKTSLSLATTTFERQKRLWNQKIGSELQYLQVKAQKESLEDKLASLQTKARKMKIIAPFSGVIDEIFTKKGELTSPQYPIVRLINLSEVYLEADVTETFLPIVKIGTETKINFPSLNYEEVSKVYFVGNYINPTNRSFKIRIGISNDKQAVKPNLLADIKIQDFQAEGITIPANLVQQDQNGNDYVFTLDKENKVVKKSVEVQNEYNNTMFISSGLDENEALINEGARIVKSGDAVKIKN